MGERRFLGFCRRFHLPSPFPVSEQTLMAFMALLYQEKLAASTVKNYLAAVRFAQIAMGFGDPHMGEMPRLEYVVKGFKRSAGSAPQGQRLPIMPGILEKLKRVWQGYPSKRDAAMLWAAATMCFLGFLRSGEVVAPSDGSFDPAVHLAYADARINSNSPPQMLEVRIKASKTDPFRKGVGRTDDRLCPVAATLSYMIQRGSSRGPLFVFENGKYLTRVRFVAAMREALKEAGFDPSRYAGHSFQIGAATTATQRGVQDSLIKTLGRWESATYMVYVRTSRDTLCGVARTLVGQGNGGRE